VINLTGKERIGIKASLEKLVIDAPGGGGKIPVGPQLFSTAFKSYPSPVFSMEYLTKAMSEHVLFKVAEEGGVYCRT
jgi:hypothetical protein